MSAKDIPFYGPEAVAHALPYPDLIEALRVGFRNGCGAPPRTVHPVSGKPGALLVLMPVSGVDSLAVKVATVFPENATRADVPVIQALVLLFDGMTGEPRAVLDGTEMTRRRTAAASALAASYLAREDAGTLLIIGTGALVAYLVGAHSTVRPIQRVEIGGRSPARAAAAAEQCRALYPALEILVSPDIAAAAGRADLICCATSAQSPVLFGRWLRDGVHVDLVGSFSPAAREADDDLVRAARIVVDTRAGALTEAGDLLIPFASGALRPEQIAGELGELCRGQIAGREHRLQRTIFKSVGCALEDLVAAELTVARYQ
jgi:ornithine cyclodeaminase